MTKEKKTTSPKISKIETLKRVEDGNTESLNSLSDSKKKKAKKQSNQLVYHFFTWNNYPAGAGKALEHKLKPFCVRWEFQEETGELGTPHLQGNIELKKPMRWSELKVDKRCHSEKTRNIEAAFTYCEKDATRTGKRYTSNKEEELELITDLRLWQRRIVDVVSEKCTNKRSITWVYDDEGLAGKSQLAKYLCYWHDAIALTNGTRSNLINAVYNAVDLGSRSIILLDIPRKDGNKCPYAVVEEIKNGLICNQKYETGMKNFNSPHIVVFSNYMPNSDGDVMTKDRWNIINLEGWQKEEKENAMLDEHYPLDYTVVN